MSAVEPRRTKIVATIGPVSANKETIEALIHAGMDSARLNFSHGTHEQHAETVRLLREAQEEIRRPLALIADLQGPKLRIGDLLQTDLARARPGDRDRRRPGGEPTATCP